MLDDLTAFQRDTLYVIASIEDSSRLHELSVREILKEHYSTEINHARLYPDLNQLVEMGLVEKGTLDKRTNSYTLTQRGHHELENRHEWENKLADIEA